MLIGPILGLLPPCIDLYAWLVTGRLRRDMRMLVPYLLMAACLLYGSALSIVNGDTVPAILGIIKFVPGMLYGLWLVARGGEQPNVIDGARRGLLIAAPAAGLYGIYQYFKLPDWDSYWMTMSAVTTQGYAEAEKVRVFGPMNSAASYGHFLLAGLVLIGFGRSDRKSLLLCLPIITGLMLSSYRTAWIGLAIAIAYCCTRAGTRRRAQLIAVWIVLGSVVVMATTSFGDSVLDRLATFGSPSDDGSGQARLTEYSVLYGDAEQLVVGLGIGGLGPFGDTQPRFHPPTEHVDGSVIDAILLMGMVGGAVYLFGLGWASAQSMIAASRARDPRVIAAAAAVLGTLIAIPLSSITRGEVGILYWALVGTVTATAANTANRRIRVPLDQTFLEAPQ